MKHLFNNLSQEEKKQILEMHTPNLVNESSAEFKQIEDEGRKIFYSLDEPKKMKFKEAFKSCWKEMGLPIKLLTLGLIFVVAGIVFSAKMKANLMAALQSILAIKAFQMTTKQIKEFCDCVENKMNPKPTQTPPTDNSIPPSDPDVENQ